MLIMLIRYHMFFLGLPFYPDVYRFLLDENF